VTYQYYFELIYGAKLGHWGAFGIDGHQFLMVVIKSISVVPTRRWRAAIHGRLQANVLKVKLSISTLISRRLAQTEGCPRAMLLKPRASQRGRSF
jgi:hypothetical protein